MEYGLIGEHLGHSFSKDIHNLIGDYKYELKEIAPEKLDAFMKLHDFKAINVTIPYKQDVIPYLDEIDESAKLIGAVNTIVNKNGKLYGYNTDFYGMKSLLEKMELSVKGKNVLILGTGGTSKTACALVQSLGCASVVKVSRHGGPGGQTPKISMEKGEGTDPEKAEGTDPEGKNELSWGQTPIKIITYQEAENLKETNIIINTTPCGMFPKSDDQPINLEHFPKLEGVLDAIYNPNSTNLILDAKKRGLKAEGGLYMLVGQAIKAAEFFFDKKIENQKADKIFKTILGRKENIVLVGMPACGKTTVGKAIAKLLNRQLIDSDAEIVKVEGREISEIFAKEGEEYFRKVESQVIAQLSEKTSSVISTGGGAVLNPQNVKNLKKNGKIYFINRPLEELLPTEDRPTANSSEKIRGLYNYRLPIYKACADAEVKGGIGPEKIADQIIQIAGLEDDVKDDIATISPGIAKGQVSAPPSKSLAHRSIICAALSEGQSEISNIEYSQDILATLDCVKNLGAKVQMGPDWVKISGFAAKHGGQTPKIPGGQTPQHPMGTDPSALIFNCRESGSTLRFFIPMGIYFSQISEFYGAPVLMTRPQSIYEDLCAKNGISFERQGEKIVINTKGNNFSSGTYEVAGNISSQFITGLLFILPLLQGDSQIKLLPPVESRPYIDLTIQAMADFGVEVNWKDESTLEIKGNQKYKAKNIAVEGDYSNAAFLDVFNGLGGDVKVQGLYDHSLQGDRVYKEMFEQLTKTCPTLDISDCPDLGPILFVFAATHNGGIFTGTKRLAIKESNRGKIMCDELKKFGVESNYSENQIEIKKNQIHAPDQIIHGYNDHRIVMALSTLLTKTGGKIDDAHAVEKSFPSYFEVIKSLGIKIEKKEGLN
ncbi:MAG: AAA family ATPase [Treponema sp.]|nr:AAA family ATPase [Treponema sp.]